MSSLERDYLLELEPELRRSAIRKAYPRRRVSRSLAVALGALRVYVVCSIVLVILTFAHAVHR